MIRPVHMYSANSRLTSNNSINIKTQNIHNNLNFTGICNHLPDLYQGSDNIIYHTKMDYKTRELYKMLRNKIVKSNMKNFKEGIADCFSDDLQKKYHDIKTVRLDNNLENNFLCISLIYKDNGIRNFHLTDDNRIIIAAQHRSKSCKSHDSLVDKILFEIGDIKKQKELAHKSDNKEAQNVISLLLSIL